MACGSLLSGTKSSIWSKRKKIAVTGTDYVGLSIATLLSQHHEVVAVDIIPEKVDLINQRKPHIRMQTSLSLQHLPTVTARRISLIHLQWKPSPSGHGVFLEKSLWMRANKELQIRPKPAIITASTRFSSCTVRVLHFLCKTAKRGGCLQNVDSASGLLRIKCTNSRFPKA